MNQVAGLGPRPVGEQAANFLPGTLEVAPMAGKDGVRGGDLTTEVGVAWGRQVA